MPRENGMPSERERGARKPGSRGPGSGPAASGASTPALLGAFLRAALLSILPAGLAAVLPAGPLLASDFDVIVSEIHYHPAGGEDAQTLEFVELHNLGGLDVDLSGWAFAEGILYTFPSRTVIPAGGYLVVSPDPARARSHYGLTSVAGPYGGRLDNGGEIIALVDASGRVVNRLRYGDDDGWPSAPDGLGPSLEYAGDDLFNDSLLRWAPSRVLGGTPGRENSVRTGEGGSSRIDGIINEILPGAGTDGFVELYNPTREPLDLAGHVLLLAGADRTFRLPPGTVLSAGGFRAWSAAELGFPVPAANEQFVLLGADGATIVDVLDAKPRGQGNSFGRHPDGGEDAFVLVETTRVAANRYSTDDRVVINEVQFHPPFVPPSGSCTRRCSDALQWIELFNQSGGEVDLGGWGVSKGVSFEIPAGTRLPAGRGLVVAHSAAAFRQAYPAVALVVGDWSGRLSHRADTINLRDGLGNRVDHVRYGDGGPTNDLAPEDGVDDGTFRGSSWPSGADGSGRTLERLNPRLDGRSGLAWRASSTPGGTPGEANSVFVPKPGPVVRSVRHEPLVPRSNQSVRVSCRIAAVTRIVSAEIEWASGGGAFTSAFLSDDGDGVDEEAGDGVYSAAVPPQPDGTIVRFRIFVVDTDAKSITVPLVPAVHPYTGFAGPFFLYEVDDAPPPSNGSPEYRIVMTAADVENLQSRNRRSDVLLPATFIGDGEVFHLIGVRFRGETSRNETNRSYRIDFPGEARFQGVEHLNLNGSNGGTYSSSNVREVLAADLFRRAGACYPLAYPVNLRFAGEVRRHSDSRYVRKENLDSDFLTRCFGGSDAGNLYRGRNPDGPGAANANLSYLGEDPAPYRPLYEKRTNKDEDDYSDIIALARAFDLAQTPSAIFQEEIEAVIDVRQWAEFFAIQALISNIDGGIWNNNGEDYFLYRVPEDSARPDAGKFLILPWDLNESLDNATERLFRPELATVRRFLTSPRYASLYHAELRRVRESVFARSEMRRAMSFVPRMYPASDEEAAVVGWADAYVRDRLGWLEDSVPRRLTAGAVSGGSEGGVEIVRPGDLWTFFRGLEEPSAVPGLWTEAVFDDSGWEEGPTGIGYGDGDDATDLADMRGSYTTVFARRRFQLAEPSAVTGLALVVDYDDAFVAYINGREVARSAGAPGAPGDPVAFGARSRSSHEAGTPETFVLTLSPGLLAKGSNVLAMVALNESIDSSDLSLIPTLIASFAGGEGPVAGGCEGPVHAVGDSVRLGGDLDPSLARSVLVDGIEAMLRFTTSGAGPFGARWEAEIPLEPGERRVRVSVHPLEGGEGVPIETREIVVRSAPRGFTSVSGTLQGSVEWTPGGGPYRLSGSVRVPAGSSLTVRPGTIVAADAGAELVVEGMLRVLGTEAEPAIFDAFHCDRPWAGISIAGTGTGAAAPLHVVEGASFLAGTAAAGRAGFLSVEGSRAAVAGSEFRALRTWGLSAGASSVAVRETTFEDCRGGVLATGSRLVLQDDAFLEIPGLRRSVDLTGELAGEGADRSRIERCVVRGGLLGGIRIRQAGVDVASVAVEGTAEAGLAFQGRGTLGPSVLTWSLLYGCGLGISVSDGAEIVGDHATVTGCRLGIRAFDGGAGPGKAALESSIVWRNETDVSVDASSSVALAFSNVGGPPGWPGQGNISLPPLFRAAWTGDFSLLPGSPCIGSGKDATDMGAFAFGGSGVIFLRGDANQTGQVDISDAIATLNYLFFGGEASPCLDALDSDDSGRVDMTDAIFTLRFLFQGGDTIPPPYPAPGVDPTEDSLACEG